MIAGAALVALLITQASSSDDDSIACRAAPPDDSSEFVYGLRAGSEPVTAETRDETIELVCRRLRKVGIASAQVGALAGDRIRLALSDDSEVQRASEQVASMARLYFYDWEPNLIGRERAIAGLPGQAPPLAALDDANEEWETAGRSASKQENQRLIAAGALPTAYDAVQLAKRQAPVPDCVECSIYKPRYYLFSGDEEHRLIAGPAFAREDLFAAATGSEGVDRGVVEMVPPGTIVVSEQPVDSLGRIVEGIENAGWYVLRDRPALGDDDIAKPKQETDEFGQPNVTFEFTDDGRDAFQRLTRAIAQRGQASAIGVVDEQVAEQSSGHLVVVLDDEVKVKPIINFAQSPDGIDGRTGAQISGGFSSLQEAGDLAAMLRFGPLPLQPVPIGLGSGVMVGE
jgi:SecD/SecF fusion protein